MMPVQSMAHHFVQNELFIVNGMLARMEMGVEQINSWWRHQMKTFSVLLKFAGHRWIPSKNASDTELRCLICAWMNDWVNNREDGDLTRHTAHYDVSVMW